MVTGEDTAGACGEAFALSDFVCVVFFFFGGGGVGSIRAIPANFLLTKHACMSNRGMHRKV